MACTTTMHCQLQQTSHILSKPDRLDYSCRRSHGILVKHDSKLWVDESSGLMKAEQTDGSLCVQRILYLPATSLPRDPSTNQLHGAMSEEACQVSLSAHAKKVGV